MYARFIRLSWINQNSLDFVVVVVVFWGLWSERCFSKYKMSLRLNFASFFFIFSFCFFSCLESTVWMFYIVCFINFFLLPRHELEIYSSFELGCCDMQKRKSHRSTKHENILTQLREPQDDKLFYLLRQTDRQTEDKKKWMNKQINKAQSMGQNILSTNTRTHIGHHLKILKFHRNQFGALLLFA